MTKFVLQDGGQTLLCHFKLQFSIVDLHNDRLCSVKTFSLCRLPFQKMQFMRTQLHQKIKKDNLHKIYPKSVIHNQTFVTLKLKYSNFIGTTIKVI